MIFLPFPPKELSPNARPHWAKLTKVKKAYRFECCIEAKLQGIKKLDRNQKLHVSLVFYPPDKRKRDDDNMQAAIKSGLDGLADALGVDDNNWKLSSSVSSETGNKVSVEISEISGEARQRVVVCAACRVEGSGFDGPYIEIIAGARHFDKTMRVQIMNSPLDWKMLIAEQGFIDQFGVFMTREEAYDVAKAAEQIKYRCGGDAGRLFSENLY